MDKYADDICPQPSKWYHFTKRSIDKFTGLLELEIRIFKYFPMVFVIISTCSRYVFFACVVCSFHLFAIGESTYQTGEIVFWFWWLWLTGAVFSEVLARSMPAPKSVNLAQTLGGCSVKRRRRSGTASRRLGMRVFFFGFLKWDVLGGMFFLFCFFGDVEWPSCKVSIE